MSGAGPVYLLRDQGQEALLAARFRLAVITVEIANQAFTHGRINYPPGSWTVSAGKGARADELDSAIEAVSQELALDFRSAARLRGDIVFISPCIFLLAAFNQTL